MISETCGEASTLTPAEQESIIRTAVETARGSVRVIAGAGSNSTSQAIELTQRARSRRRGCGAFGGALLQQADASRNPGAFPGDCDLHRSADHPARRSIPHHARDYPTTRCCGWPSSRHFIGLKDGTGDLTRPVAPAAAACRQGFGYCPETTRRRFPSSPMVGTAAFPSYRTSRRNCARSIFSNSRLGRPQSREIPAEPAGAVDGSPREGKPGRTEVRALPARLHVPGHPPAHRRTGRRRKSGGRKRDRGDRR